MPLPDSLADGYVRLQHELAGPDGRDLPDVKWVERGNLHLTLKFLGNVDRDRVPLLEEALRKTARTVAGPAVLEARSVTAFPSEREPRVLVVELADASGALPRLHAAIERELTALGFPAEERPFQMHLTIGRARGGRARARPRLAGLGAPPGRWEVEAFDLIESRTGAAGPIYTPLTSFRLGGGTKRG